MSVKNIHQSHFSKLALTTALVSIVSTAHATLKPDQAAIHHWWHADRTPESEFAFQQPVTAVFFKTAENHPGNTKFRFCFQDPLYGYNFMTIKAQDRNALATEYTCDIDYKSRHDRLPAVETFISSDRKLLSEFATDAASLFDIEIEGQNEKNYLFTAQSQLKPDATLRLKVERIEGAGSVTTLVLPYVLPLKAVQSDFVTIRGAGAELLSHALASTSGHSSENGFPVKCASSPDTGYSCKAALSKEITGMYAESLYKALNVSAVVDPAHPQNFSKIAGPIECHKARLDCHKAQAAFSCHLLY